jgi:DNA-binding IclR family transcriptional regulator
MATKARTEQHANVDDTDESAETGRRVATIERAVDVLFLFTDDDRASLGVTEISNDLGISKAVVHRILTSLRDRDLVIADPNTRKYSLGPAVLTLAASYFDQLDVRPMAIEAMERLSQETSETATLSIRNGFQRIYVEQVTPPLEVRMTVRTGRPYPLHAGSSSKAFLAFLSQAEQDEFFATQALDPLTAATVTDVAAFRRELDQIRQQGFATSLGERQAGAASVAAPVFDREGPVAVISVCGPLERLRDRIAEIAVLVLDETRSLSTRLGHRG